MNRLQDALYAQLNTREHPSGPDDPRAHASEAGQCARQIWYRIRRVPVSNPRPLTTLIAFQIGTDLHAHLQAAIARIHPDAAIEVYWEREHISGHADARYSDSLLEDAVVEIKTASPFAWAHMKQPKREHLLQAGINAVGLNTDRIHIVYLNIAAKAGDDPIREFVARAPDDDALGEMARLTSVALAAAADTPVRREYDGREIDPFNDSYPCSYCPFRTRCTVDGS